MEQAGNLSHEDEKPRDSALSFQLLMLIVVLVWTIVVFPIFYHNLGKAIGALLVGMA